MKTLLLLAVTAGVIAMSIAQSDHLKSFPKFMYLHDLQRGIAESSNDGGSGDSSDTWDTMATGSGDGQDSGSSSEDSSEGGATGSIGSGNNQGPSSMPASLAPGPGDTAQPTADTTAEPSLNCTLAQECTVVDLLTQHIGETGHSISALYLAAFSIFNENSFTRSVHTLLHEFNYRSTIQCAGNFSEFNDTAFQVTQADASGVFEYFLPVAQTPGHPRTLQNSQVDVTLPNLGTLGDLRLRYFFDWSGDVQTVQRFIRPPNQATDMFFPFPLRETVSTVWLAYDQYLK